VVFSIDAAVRTKLYIIIVSKYYTMVVARGVSTQDHVCPTETLLVEDNLALLKAAR
jgi:hypothetical protein